MKKTLFSAIALFVAFAANAQIATLPASQSFTDAFSATTGTAIAIYPNYTANTVAAATRIFRDETDFATAPAALSAIPTGSFTGTLDVALNLTNYSNVAVSFVAKSMQNSDGTRPSTVSLSTSVDGGTTWIGSQLLGSFPNQNQTAFTNLSYAVPADANHQANVLVRFTIDTGTGGDGTRAKVVIDDLLFAVTSTPQLSASTPSLTFNQTLGLPSATQSVSVSGTNLSSDAALSVAAPFEISLSAASGFGTSVTVPQQSGTIAAVPVYVRLNSTTAADATGTLSIQSSGISTTVALTGTVQTSIATNPEPFDLSTGNYSFTEWAASSASGTYPANMVFWTHATTDPTIDIPFNENYTCLYSLTSRSRFNGLGENGVSMINTGNSQYVGVCDGSDPADTSATVVNGRAGAIVLGLNATGRQDLSVNWTAATVTQNDRTYSLRVQYRIGAGNPNTNWTDIANGDNAFTQYTSGEAGNAATFTTVLPAAVNNQPVVEVRWVYNYIATDATGSRSEVSLDNVSVTTNEYLGLQDFTADKLAMYPNPANGGVVNFSLPVRATVYDYTGKIVYTSDNEVSSINVSGFASGIYLVKTTNGITKKLIVK